MVLLATATALSRSTLLLDRRGRDRLDRRQLGAPKTGGAWRGLDCGGTDSSDRMVLFSPRNLDLYGDLTGATALQHKFGRSQTKSTVELTLDPRFHLALWQDTWGSFSNNVRLGTGVLYGGPRLSVVGTSLVSGACLASAAVAGGVRAVRRSSWTASRSEIAIWGGALAWIVVCVVGVTSFASGGGTPHPRYLLPAMPVIAALVVMGVTSLVGLSRAWLLLVGALGLIDLLLLARLQQTLEVEVESHAGMGLPGWLSWQVMPAVVLSVLAGLAALTAARPKVPASAGPQTISSIRCSATLAHSVVSGSTVIRLTHPARRRAPRAPSTGGRRRCGTSSSTGRPAGRATRRSCPGSRRRAG